MTETDFGGFQGAEPYARRHIATLDDLESAVRMCVERRCPIRTRAFAHSMNGMSMARPDETLLDMRDVRHVSWMEDGVVVAGAGLSVWELDQYVRGFGWKLPVINDGGSAAPSVGGFVAAGGIGAGSIFHGGFWETVRALTVVTGTGDIRRLDRDSPIFPWMFGGMGGLGIVFEAAIDLVQAGEGPVSPVAPCASLPPTPSEPWPDHLWLTLFVPESRRDEAAERLAALIAAHPLAWVPREPYEYYLARQRFNPPLVLGGEGDHIALGTWGDRLPRTDGLNAYLAMEADFQAMIEGASFRRYFQSELIREHRDLARYVGAAAAEAYRRLKAELDPLNLLNAFPA